MKVRVCFLSYWGLSKRLFSKTAIYRKASQLLKRVTKV